MRKPAYIKYGMEQNYYILLITLFKTFERVCLVLYNRDNKHECLFSKIAPRIGAYTRGMPIFMGCLKT